MPNGLLDRIKQQTASLTFGERAELEAFLHEQNAQAQARQTKPEDVAAVEKEILRAQHKAWMQANRPRYGGLYAALDGTRLLGTGRNYREAVAIAQQTGVPDAFIDYVMPLEAIDRLVVGQLGEIAEARTE